MSDARSPNPHGRDGARPTWVVVPARNEAGTIGWCLRALRDAAARVPGAVHVLVVDDASTDDTAARARRALHAMAPVLAGTVLQGRGEGVGWARRVGLEAALAEAAGDRTALIATTDADSVVDPEWIAAMHRRLDQGHQVIAGDVRLDPSCDPRLADARARRLHRRLAALPAAEAGGPHPHFAGSSLGFAADALRRLGPLPTPRALEDEAVLHVCRTLGIAVLRDAETFVTTSARLVGRAEGGLAAALTHDYQALSRS